MNRNRLQLVNVHQITEKPPVKSLFGKFKDIFSNYTDETDEHAGYMEEEIESDNNKYIKCDTESRIIAGFILEHLRPDIKIFEAGCGKGELFKHLCKFPLHYTGIDVSANNIDIARNTYLSLGKPAFFNAGLKDFSTKSRFDIIVINDILNSYKFIDIKNILKKAVSLQRNNSSLIFILSQQNIKSLLVWKIINRFPLPEIDIAIKNYSTGNQFTIKAFKGVTL